MCVVLIHTSCCLSAASVEDRNQILRCAHRGCPCAPRKHIASGVASQVIRHREKKATSISQRLEILAGRAQLLVRNSQAWECQWWCMLYALSAFLLRSWTNVSDSKHTPINRCFSRRFDSAVSLTLYSPFSILLRHGVCVQRRRGRLR